MATVTKWRDCTLTIANGQTESQELLLEQNGVRRAKIIQISGPTTLPETVTVHLGDGVGGTYKALSSGGSDFTIPAAKTVSLPTIVKSTLKLIAGGAVGADRVFIVEGVAVNGI